MEVTISQKSNNKKRVGNKILSLFQYIFFVFASKKSKCISLYSYVSIVNKMMFSTHTVHLKIKLYLIFPKLQG